jgi:putative heme-binding domain-containing protein
MYREVIEHPWSLPPGIKQYLDLNNGNDRGRIYRIVPEDFKPRQLPRLSKATTAELVVTLEHANGWHRDTAARLLYERQDRTAVPLLEKLTVNSKSPFGRLHALYALDGLGALSQTHIAKALTDADDAVREHGTRLAEKLFRHSGESIGKLWKQVMALTNDPSPYVRYQLAFTLGELHHPDRIKTLAELALHDVESRWMQAAVLSSLRLPNGPIELFDAICTQPRVRDGKAGQEFLRQLSSIIGAQNRSQDVTKLLLYLQNAAQSPVAATIVSGLGNGLQRAGSSLVKADQGDVLQQIFKQAAATASDERKSETTRAQAAQLLAWADFAKAKSPLVALLGSRQPQALQLAAIEALGRFSGSEVAAELVPRWPGFTPRVRSEALTVLLARPERVAALLSAIEGETIRPAELSSTQITFLRGHRDTELRQRAVKLFGGPQRSDRDQIVKTFLPALNLTGEAARGHVIYQNRCAACHRIGSEGYALGPDLATVKASGKEKILISILDPNREVVPSYLNYLVETKDGESLLGIIGGETGTSLTLRQANGVEQTVFRSNIARIQSQGQSAMPEGLETGLNQQDLADLLEFLMAQK